MQHSLTHESHGYDNGDKLMNIPNDDTQNYPYCRIQLVDTQLDEPSKLIQRKSQKLLSQPMRKCYYKTLGTSFPCVN